MSKSSATACSASATVEPQLLRWAYDNGVPLVATNKCYFAKPDDFEAHDALLCIAGGRLWRNRSCSIDARPPFQVAMEMAVLFADLPEALTSRSRSRNAAPIGRPPASRSCRVSSGRRAAATPRARKPPDCAEPSRDCGSHCRVTALRSAPREDYDKRLDYELDVITKMKYAGYFLIVADFIKWSKARG